MIFTKSLPCSLITQNPKPAKGLAVLQRSLSSALQIKYAVTASHSGDFLSPKLSGIVKCKAYAKGPSRLVWKAGERLRAAAKRPVALGSRHWSPAMRPMPEVEPGAGQSKRPAQCQWVE